MTDAATRADASNWCDAPHRGWAFHHIPEVLATTPIAAAPGATSPLLETSQLLEGFALEGLDGTPLDLDGYLAATATDAMVILRQGAVVFERYANGMTPEAPHIFMSCSKAITGLVAGIAHEAGLLDLDAPASAYVPEIARSAFAGASLRHLLDMRTAVTPEAELLKAHEQALQGGLPTIHAILPAIQARDGEPGGPFRYISANTDLAGWAIERASGRPFAELASDLLWKPMGAERDAAIITDREGAPWCSGGVCATARDFARVGQLLLDGGRGIASQGLIDDLTAGGDREAWRTGEWGQIFTPIGKAMSYRAGWYTVDDAPAYLFAMGVHGQNLFVDFEAQIVIAKFSSQERFDYPVVGLTHQAMREFRRRLLA